MTKPSDLVEDSLRLLDASSVDEATFRAVAARLYEFESNYVTRATYFRIMDVLLEHGYFVTVPLEEHPRYEAHRDHLASLEADSISPIFREPSREWSEQDNPVVGFAAGGELYAERGSELWEELVEAGLLEGEAAEMPDEETLFGAVAHVCEAAADRGEYDLPLRWYAALGFYLGMESGRDEGVLLEQLDEDPGVERIRRVVAQVDDLELKLADPSRGLELPPPPLRQAHPVLERWFDLL